MPDETPDNSTPWPALMNASTVARYCDCSPRSIWRGAATGEFPAPIRCPAGTRWRKSDIDSYLESLKPAPERRSA